MKGVLATLYDDLRLLWNVVEPSIFDYTLATAVVVCVTPGTGPEQAHLLPYIDTGFQQITFLMHLVSGLPFTNEIDELKGYRDGVKNIFPLCNTLHKVFDRCCAGIVPVNLVDMIIKLDGYIARSLKSKSQWTIKTAVLFPGPGFVRFVAFTPTPSTSLVGQAMFWVASFALKQGTPSSTPHVLTKGATLPDKFVSALPSFKLIVSPTAAKRRWARASRRQ